MHWIGVGIMVWIGLKITPAILGLVIWLLPGAFGAATGALILGLMFHSLGGAWLGALLGGLGLHILIWKNNSI